MDMSEGVKKMTEHKGLVFGGSGIVGLIAAGGLYASLATEAWTEKRIDEKLIGAPITREAEMRIAPLEKDVKEIKEDVGEVKHSVEDIDDNLDEIKVQLGILIRQGEK